uniref:Solute carrier family 12 member 8 n=1 Tax=Haplochromis burtoni TaxID=8153 RepID=A0A3Q2VK83_HAPBU
DLFHEDAKSNQPWWRIKVFVWEPVLFGTWDGVFTTCMINIFGVVLFLRTGYLVGNTGVLLGMVLVSMVVLVALVTVMSGIGVSEHCGVGSGGIYSMISTILGGRVGGTVGLLYVFGQLQCVAGAMYITGFSESVAELLGLQTQWAVRCMSAAVLLGLLGINLAGVKWIVRLQLLLLAVLAISTLDFVIGTFTHLDPHGFIGYSAGLLSSNTMPDYTTGENFFTVFGVFFPAATVMAGFNMSSDLQRPEHNIPVGTLAAVFTWFLYLVFVFLLGAICTREALRCDFLIAEKKGPNKTPVAAIFLTSLVTMAFIFIGQVNVLAPIVTINFMLTYSFVDYSYFSVAMTSHLQNKDKRDTAIVGKRNQRRSTRHSSTSLIQANLPNYGSDGGSPQSKGTLLEFTRDMDQIFPPVSNVDSAAEKTSCMQDMNNTSKNRKATAKQKLMDSFGLDSNSSVSSEEKEERTSSASLAEEDQGPGGGGELKAGEEPQITGYTDVGHVEQDLPADTHNYSTTGDKAEHQSFEIQPKHNSFYAKLCNRWIALIGALSSILIMFVIQWVYALTNIIFALLLFFYIGKTSPGLPRGIAAQFSFFTWFKSTLSSICRKASPRDEIVVTPSLSGTLGLKTKQLTEENADFASRHRCHQSSFIRADNMVQPPFH